MENQYAHETEMQAMMNSGEQSMRHLDLNEVELAPGETKTLIWTFTRADSIEYGCHEPGHFAAGRVGHITVSGG